MSRCGLLRIACSAFLAASLTFLAAQAIAPRAGAAEPQPNVQALAKVMAVQDRNTARLMSIKGVVGTATGLDAAGRPVVKVFLAQPGVLGIPARLDGEAVEAEVTGEFLALGKPAKPPAPPAIDRTARFDSPVPIGVSTGNEFKASAGTIGCRLVDLDTGTRYALSNVHVFDPWHYGAYPDAAALFERIVQPGRIDDPLDDLYGAATPENIVGTVVDCVPINFSGGDNFVDAAIAIVPAFVYEGYGVCRTLGNSTPADGYGVPSATTVVADKDLLGRPVQKYGRTTGLTKGTVTSVNGIVNVGYDGRTARFVDQIIVENRTAFIKPGDSGSLLVTQAGNQPTGLLFAGNSTGKMAIANHIDVVLGAFGVDDLGPLLSIDGQ